MSHLCKACGREAARGEEYCVRHLPIKTVAETTRLAWWPIPLLVTVLVVTGLWLTLRTPTSGEPRVAVSTVATQPTATVTITPTATMTPLPTITPTPRSTVTPLPPNTPEEVLMTSDVMYVAAALVDAEARGMGRTGMMVVACNVLTDYWEVAGNWRALTGRWAPLARILGGEAFPQPSELAQKVVQDANGTPVCRDYPRCQFLGTLYDLASWRSLGYIDEGTVNAKIYAGPSGQTLVCIEGRPELPVAPGK